MRAADVVTEKLELFRLPDGSLQTLDRQRILGSDVNVSLRRTHRVGGNQHSLNHAMRITLQDAAVHESAGIAFVRIADYKFSRAYRFCHRAPLQASGIARPSSSAQAALGYLFNDFGGRHFRERLDEGAISGGGDVLFNPLGIDYTGVLQHNFLLPLEKWNVGRTNQALNRALFQSIQQRRGVACGYSFV